MTKQEFLKWEADSRDSIDVKRSYIDIAGDLVAGIMLSQLIYWYLPDKSGNTKIRIEKESREWIAKHREDWWGECRISPKQVDRATALLKKKGILTTKIFKFSGKNCQHYSLNFNILLTEIQTYQKVNFTKGELTEKENLPNGNFTKGENETLPKGNSKIDERSVSSTAENTAENTAETTSDPPIKSADRVSGDPVPKTIAGKETLSKSKFIFDNTIYQVLHMLKAIPLVQKKGKSLVQPGWYWSFIREIEKYRIEWGSVIVAATCLFWAENKFWKDNLLNCQNLIKIKLIFENHKNKNLYIHRASGLINDKPRADGRVLHVEPNVKYHVLESLINRIRESGDQKYDKYLNIEHFERLDERSRRELQFEVYEIWEKVIKIGAAG